jgi:uncharacterized membrane protein YheB (UPF0754 family)
MNAVEFRKMTTPQLVSFYNRHSAAPVKRFSDRKTAERRCSELLSSLEKSAPSGAKVLSQKTTQSGRPAMQTSLKLDRTITCVETGGTWKNAHQMWVENPDWMTSSQQDRLTAQLYAAAKQGELKPIVINGYTFMLVNVPKVKK